MGKRFLEDIIAILGAFIRNNNMKCFECDGEYEKVAQGYECHTSNGNKITVSNVEVLTCNSCGDKVLDNDALVQIDKAKDLLKGGISVISDLYQKMSQDLKQNKELE
jgi:hypothetical protein